MRRDLLMAQRTLNRAISRDVHLRDCFTARLVLAIPLAGQAGGGVELAPGATADGCLAEAIRERLRELFMPPGSLGRSEYRSKLVNH
jgi:hypothetical protein